VVIAVVIEVVFVVVVIVVVAASNDSSNSTTDPEARVRFPALPEKKNSVSGTGSTQPREFN
jgi:ABC-type phosphate transport system substrate-binding protein